ncbi:MAG: hypothetical protein JWR69_3764, partial [Pedosphaera sp.]|nr:hypothetical protein [Pedosphaera sp.]
STAVPIRLRSLLALTCLLGAVGCSTTTDNWNSRIGSYTYSDMVSDYGAPLTANASAGSGTMAQWVVYRERRPGDYGHAAGGADPHKTIHRRAGSIWRTDYLYEMTFDPAGRLTSWKKIAQ